MKVKDLKIGDVFKNIGGRFKYKVTGVHDGYINCMNLDKGGFLRFKEYEYNK